MLTKKVVANVAEISLSDSKAADEVCSTSRVEAAGEQRGGWRWRRGRQQESKGVDLELNLCEA